jgi:hypothetical protein
MKFAFSIALGPRANAGGANVYLFVVIKSCFDIRGLASKPAAAFHSFKDLQKSLRLRAGRQTEL